MEIINNKNNKNINAIILDFDERTEETDALFALCYLAIAGDDDKLLFKGLKYLQEKKK